MNAALTPAQRRRDLTAYFLLTYTLSWAVEVPIALAARGLLAAPVPLALHYLASFGPMLTAVGITLARDGAPGLRRLCRGLGRWRCGREVLLFAVVLPLSLFAALILVTRLVEGAWPDLRTLGQVDYLGAVGILPALGLWLLTFGLGEEVGWRGFALPRLQAGRSALSASLILGLFWAGWHLPALFYRDTYQALGLLVVPMLLAIATVGSITYTWLYNSTGGSLLVLVVYHGLYDYLSVWEGGVVSAGMLLTVVMIFYVVRAVKGYGPANLAPVEKVTV